MEATFSGNTTLCSPFNIVGTVNNVIRGENISYSLYGHHERALFPRTVAAFRFKIIQELFRASHFYLDSTVTAYPLERGRKQRHLTQFSATASGTRL